MALGRRAAHPRRGVPRRPPRRRHPALGAVGRGGLRHLALPTTVRQGRAHEHRPRQQRADRRVRDARGARPLPTCRPLADRRHRAPVGPPRVAGDRRQHLADRGARRDRERGRRAGQGVRHDRARSAPLPRRHRARRRAAPTRRAGGAPAPCRRRGAVAPGDPADQRTGRRRLPRRDEARRRARQRGARRDRRRGRAAPGARRRSARLRRPRRRGHRAAAGRLTPVEAREGGGHPALVVGRSRPLRPRGRPLRRQRTALRRWRPAAPRDAPRHQTPRLRTARPRREHLSRRDSRRRNGEVRRRARSLRGRP